MYTEFFNLKEKPFNLTPSPRFLYLSESHKEALALLTYGVIERKGFVLLTGEVGTGKTTILQTLLGSLDKRVQCVHLSNPLLSPAEFLDYLSHAVFKTPTGKKSKTEFLLQFEEYLRKSTQQQSNFVLVIDEAQKLSFDLLEEIRLLSNMETADEKLINIFLVGQPELNQKLSETRCRPLLQRISVRHHISPLNLKETGEYVGTRLKVAGARDPDRIFPSGTIKALHRCSKGYPRMINILADNALLSAYSNDSKRVTSKMIEQCSEDLHLSAPTVVSGPSAAAWSGSETEKGGRKRSGAAWKWPAAAAVLVAAAGLFIMSQKDVLLNRISQAVVTNESPAVSPPTPVVVEPVPTPSEPAKASPAPAKEEIKAVMQPKAGKEELKAMALPKPEKEKITVEIAKPQVEEKVLQSSQAPAAKVEELKAQIPSEPPVMEEIKAGQATTPVKIEITEKADPETKTEIPPAQELLNRNSERSLRRGSASEPKQIESLREAEDPPRLAVGSFNVKPAIAATGQSSGTETWLVAKKGDTLSKLSVDVYGRVDERILYTLQRKNPSISNIHLIAVGQEIYFPPARALEEDSK